MSDRQDPLTPADCDLRGMPYMPLDMVRLFDSDFYALSTGDEFKAGLSLWGKAFLQIPAGSLPNDDRLLAHLSGAGTNWKRVRDMALRGWFECSDGRLYHRTVAEKALEAWKARLDRRARTEAARAARQASRGPSGSDPPPSVTETVTASVTDNVTSLPTRTVATSVTADVTGSKGSTREGKGREEKKEREDTPPPPASGGRSRAALEDPDFARFYAAYPRHVEPDDALKAWRQVTRGGATPEQIMAGLEQCRFSTNPERIKYPASWLRAGGWKNAPSDQFDPVLRAAGLSPDDMDITPMRGLLQ